MASERDYSSILDRLGKSTGPDRELDFAIGATLDGWERKWSEDRETHRGGWYMRQADFSWSHYSVALLPQYTDSLDAAIALVERMLPGWNFQVHGTRGAASVLLYEPGVPFRDVPKAQSGVMVRPICLAFLIALFRALQGQGGGRSEAYPVDSGGNHER